MQSFVSASNAVHVHVSPHPSAFLLWCSVLRFRADKIPDFIAVQAAHFEVADVIHPLPKLGRKAIYLNVLHGGHFADSDSNGVTVDSSSCFPRIAIPEDGSKKYLCNWSAQEILLAYATAANAAVAPQAIEDKAKPRKKIQSLNIKKNAGGNAE
jgi:hypothetical protein